MEVMDANASLSSAALAASNQDQTRGLLLAISSSIFIGSSFIIKKKGLRLASASGLRAGAVPQVAQDASPLLPVHPMWLSRAPGLRWRPDLRHTGYELPGCTAPGTASLRPHKQFHVPVTGPVICIESSICVATGSPEPMDNMQTSP